MKIQAPPSKAFWIHWSTLPPILIFFSNFGAQRSPFFENFGPAPLQKCVGDFCCINFGGFCPDTVRNKHRIHKHKIHEHFLMALAGQSSQGRTPQPSQEQTGQNGDFALELSRKRPVCPRNGSRFVPEMGPFCARDGSCLSQTLSRPKCSCLLVFFLPEF